MVVAFCGGVVYPERNGEERLEANGLLAYTQQIGSYLVVSEENLLVFKQRNAMFGSLMAEWKMGGRQTKT